MDHDVVRFRHAADQENPRRHGRRRRYSATLQEQAVAYWRRRRGEDGLRVIAAALRVAPWTLHRWTRTARTGAAFRPIVVAPPPTVAPAVLSITLTTERPRVDGLTVEAAAQLLTRLR
jgi:transposase-like protein